MLRGFDQQNGDAAVGDNVRQALRVIDEMQRNTHVTRRHRSLIHADMLDAVRDQHSNACAGGQLLAGQGRTPAIHA